VDGVVTDTYFSLGDYVKKGQVLASKSTAVNEMQDDTQTLQAQLAVAKRKLASVEAMYKDDIASQKDLQEARAEVTILQSNISKPKICSCIQQGSTFRLKLRQMAMYFKEYFQRNACNGGWRSAFYHF
jgi:multidrug efflux pump subunit AcrA (membrane-fusion protein)